jgi:hypothetical protein
MESSEPSLSTSFLSIDILSAIAFEEKVSLCLVSAPLLRQPQRSGSRLRLNYHTTANDLQEPDRSVVEIESPQGTVNSHIRY